MTPAPPTTAQSGASDGSARRPGPQPRDANHQRGQRRSDEGIVRWFRPALAWRAFRLVVCRSRAAFFPSSSCAPGFSTTAPLVQSGQNFKEIRGISPSFSLKVCGQREDAEDTMQEVLAKALPYLPNLKARARYWCGYSRVGYSTSR